MWPSFTKPTEIDRMIEKTLLFLPVTEQIEQARKRKRLGPHKGSMIRLDRYDVVMAGMIMFVVGIAPREQPVPMLWYFAGAALCFLFLYCEIRRKAERWDGFSRFKAEIAKAVRETGDHTAWDRFSNGRLPFHEALELLNEKHFGWLNLNFPQDQLVEPFYLLFPSSTLTSTESSQIKAMEALDPGVSYTVYQTPVRRIVVAEKKLSATASLTACYRFEPIHSPSRQKPPRSLGAATGNRPDFYVNETGRPAEPKRTKGPGSPGFLVPKATRHCF